MHNVFFGKRTIKILTDHPYYMAIQEGWPTWAFLHEDDELGHVDMQMDQGTKHLLFLFSPPGDASIADRVLDYYDTLLGSARAWAEINDFVEEHVEIGDNLDVYLERVNRSRYESQHYTHASLRFATSHSVTDFTELSVAELRTLGRFLIEYADSMEDDTRDDRAPA